MSEVIPASAVTMIEVQQANIEAMARELTGIRLRLQAMEQGRGYWYAQSGKRMDQLARVADLCHRAKSQGLTGVDPDEVLTLLRGE